MTVTYAVGDATDLPLASESVDCIVTSPPYNVGMSYAGVSDSYLMPDYVRLAYRAAEEMVRTLKTGGRLWLNALHCIPEYDSIEAVRNKVGVMTGARWDAATIWRQALETAGLRYRDTIAWIQIGSHDQSTAWGSMLSPNAPNLRGRWEPILLMFKGSWDRGRVERNDLTWDDFARWTRNVWEIPSASRIDHPAPFPAEIPRRCILLSTWPGDSVLDPFVGSGTTLRVADELGRHAIGVDLSETYAERFAERGRQASLLEPR